MAHERIKLFFEKQKETLDIWQNFNFNSIEKIFKTGLIYACPYRTETGRSLGRIFKIAWIDLNKSTVTYDILHAAYSLPHSICGINLAVLISLPKFCALVTGNFWIWDNHKSNIIFRRIPAYTVSHLKLWLMLLVTQKFSDSIQIGGVELIANLETCGISQMRAVNRRGFQMIVSWTYKKLK